MARCEQNNQQLPLFLEDVPAKIRRSLFYISIDKDKTPVLIL